MDEIRRIDRKLFLSELLSPWRVVLIVVLGLVLYAAAAGLPFRLLNISMSGAAAALSASVATAYGASVQRRFHGKRYRQLWEACRDRHRRFEEVRSTMKRTKFGVLQEMPRTIEGVADALYYALRKADLISYELEKTEKELFDKPPAWIANGNDPQSRELYRVADKNIAEYQRQYAEIMSGVQRTEAQSAVFMTTLDTLRMKMLSFRLMGRAPDLSSKELLEAMTEARLQMEAIDKALEELDLSRYPTMIAVVPNRPDPSSD
jgi:hypothetical protein